MPRARSRGRSRLRPAPARAAETTALPIFERGARGAAAGRLADYLGRLRTAEIFEPRSATEAACGEELATTRAAIENLDTIAGVMFDQLRRSIPVCP